MVTSDAHMARVIALDFYDGAVGGFVELTDSSGNRGWFRYELVAWNKDQSLRVFCVATAPAVGGIIATLPEAKRQFWFPQADCTVCDKLDQVRKAAGKFTAIILSDSYINDIKAMKALTSETRKRIPAELPSYDDRDFDFWIAEVCSGN